MREKQIMELQKKSIDKVKEECDKMMKDAESRIQKEYATM